MLARRRRRPPALYIRVVRVYGVKTVSTNARPTVDSVYTFESRGNDLCLFLFFFQWTSCLPRC